MKMNDKNEITSIELFGHEIEVADKTKSPVETFKYLEEENIDAYIPDTYYRQRDPRFPEKNLKRKTKNLYSKEDFIYLENENKFLIHILY